MKQSASLLFTFSFLLAASTSFAQTATFHDYSGETITHDSIDFSMYYGKKVMVVNTASYCGYTHQYNDLQELYDNYHQYNFEILGFPCNDFSNQEPGADSTIEEFCENYNITFQMMSKIATVSADTAPVYKWLQREDLNGVADAPVSWNFNKYLIDEAGHWVAHHLSPVSPTAQVIIDWIMSPSVLTGIENTNNRQAVILRSSNPGNTSIDLMVNSPSLEKISIRLFSADGQLTATIYEGVSSAAATISYDISSLSAGIYFISVNGKSINTNLRYAVVR